MSEQDDLRVVQEVYADFGRGDVAGVVSRLTDDVRWTTPGPPDVIPYAGTKRGHAGVTGYFEAFGAAARTTAFDPGASFAGHGRVVVLGHYAFTVVATGKVVDHDFVHVFTLADGKISAFEGYEDSAAVVAAFTAG